jgi:protein O-mannosyl-transferase
MQERSALFCAALFAVLPGKAEEVLLIANLGGVLAAALTLGSFWAYQVDLQERKPWALPLSLTFLGLGLLTKETAIAVPALIVLTGLLFHRDQWRDRSIPRWKLAGLAHFVVATVYLIWRFGILRITSPEGAPVAGLIAAIRSAPEILISYLRLLIFPSGLSPYHLFAFRGEWLTPVVIGTWVGILFLGALIVTVGRKTPLFAYGFLFFGICLAPTMNLIPLARPFSEHYLYLSTAGFCIAATAIWARAFDARKTLGALLALVLIVAYGAVSFRYAGFWKDDCTLWQRAYDTTRGSDEAANNLGTCFFEQGRLEQAEKLFEEAYQLNATNKKAAYNLARVAIERRDWERARAMVERALKQDSKYDKALIASGLIGYGAGKSPEQTVQWVRALSSRWPRALLGYAAAADRASDPRTKEFMDLYFRQSSSPGS